MPRTLLLSFAHPDDESFLAGGSACRYAAAGFRVVLASATRGESGKAGDPPLCPPGELADLRERELREAAAILGIAEVHFLGYRDRELAAAPPDAIRQQLVALIRRERPPVVLTFDPNGANLHPDHVAISRFTIDAVAAAGDPRWFPGARPPHIVPRLLWVPGRHPWEWAREANPGGRPGVDFAIDVSGWRDRKLAALQAHRTQDASVRRHFLDRADRDRVLSVEFFRQAGGPTLPTRPLADLFEGIGREALE
ncbi:MAG TPA: PIG-L deacetylase family protein [Myxococcota bacterium]|nr:PIG-L deacetylase family protein [Myxococcota bacterium]